MSVVPRTLRVPSPPPPAALALRTVVLVAPVLALTATSVQGPRPRGLLVVVVLLLSLGSALRPASPMLTVDLWTVIAWWGLAARHDVPAAVVPAAWLLLAAHLAATLLSYGPPLLPVSAALARRWTPRALGLAAVPPLLWLLATEVDDQPRPPALWALALGAAAALCVAAAVAVRRGSAS